MTREEMQRKLAEAEAILVEVRNDIAEANREDLDIEQPSFFWQDSLIEVDTALTAIQQAQVGLLDDNTYDDYDDSMDGDHASALASAGMGTDEDYGYYGGDDFY